MFDRVLNRLAGFSCFVKISQTFLFYSKITRKDISNPASNYLFKVNNRNTRTRCEIYSKLTIKTLAVLVSLLLTLNIFRTSL